MISDGEHLFVGLWMGNFFIPLYILEPRFEMQWLLGSSRTVADLAFRIC